MKKKLVLALLMAMLLAGGAFGQKEHRHQPFDVLIGLNFGFGISPNTFGLLGSLSGGLSEGNIRHGNYAITIDFGVTGDFYIFSWLSVNTGLLVHPDLYAFWNQDIQDLFDPGESIDFSGIFKTPICLTIPIAAHVNIPKVEWLYMGAGVSLNIPLFSLLDSVVSDFDTKGEFFVGLPIDLGFDFVRPGRGGMRFFFRVTPEFHKGGTTVPIGFIWQIWNWKVFGK